jgi:hypothetical protein
MQKRKFRAAVLTAAAAGALSPVVAKADFTGFNGFAAANFGINNATATDSTIGYTGNGSTFTLTDGQGSEQSSGFNAVPQDITSFQASFTYTVATTNTARTQYGLADGFTFIMQDDSRGTAAIGGTGGSKGYIAGTGAAYAAITPSAAVGYEMYGGQTSYYYQDTIQVSSNTSIPILNNGHPIQVQITYRDNVLNTSFFDTVNKSSIYLTQTGVNLPTLLGSNTAYIGFGGGTGGAASTQTVSNVQFKSTVTTPATMYTTPLALTGFNQDMVVEASAPQIGAAANVTATMDTGTAKTGATYYEQGYNTTNASSITTGLPLSGSTFTSQADSRHIFTMQSYTGNNALLLTSTNVSGTLTLASPMAMSGISVLAATGNGVAPFNVTINYSDGAPSTLVPYDQVVPDWFFQGPAAWDAQGRVYPATTASTFDNVNNNQPNLYQLDIPLTDTSDPVSSITFNYDGTTGGGNVAIFAVSAAVPEPASIGLLAGGAATMLVRRRRTRSM